MVNATDYHGATPLHLACQKGYQSVTVSSGAFVAGCCFAPVSLVLRGDCTVMLATLHPRLLVLCPPRSTPALLQQ